MKSVLRVKSLRDEVRKTKYYTAARRQLHLHRRCKLHSEALHCRKAAITLAPEVQITLLLVAINIGHIGAEVVNAREDSGEYHNSHKDVGEDMIFREEWD